MSQQLERLLWLLLLVIITSLKRNNNDSELFTGVKHELSEMKSSLDNCVKGSALTCDACKQCNNNYVSLRQLIDGLNSLKKNGTCSYPHLLGLGWLYWFTVVAHVIVHEPIDNSNFVQFISFAGEANVWRDSLTYVVGIFSFFIFMFYFALKLVNTIFEWVIRIVETVAFVFMSLCLRSAVNRRRASLSWRKSLQAKIANWIYVFLRWILLPNGIKKIRRLGLSVDWWWCQSIQILPSIHHAFDKWNSFMENETVNRSEATMLDEQNISTTRIPVQMTITIISRIVKRCPHFRKIMSEILVL